MKQTVLWLGVSALLHAQSVLTTFAGTDWIFPGDGKPAINAPLGRMSGITVDLTGNPVISVADDCFVARIQTNGILSILAGTGLCGFSGERGPAVNAGLGGPGGPAFDAQGNLYIPTVANVRKVTTAGTISLFAGDSTFSGFTGDNGPAVKATILASNSAVATDSEGNVYIADAGNHRVRRVSPAGIITTVAGNGTTLASGDGGQATSAGMAFPLGVATDAAGNLYIAHTGAIRKVTKAGIISTIATANPVASVAADAAGTVYYASSNSIFRILPGATTATLFAGNATPGYSGDGGPPLNARFQGQLFLAVDRNGIVYVADSGNGRVRKIANGVVTTVAGNGNYRYNGEGTPALSSPLGQPFGLTVDSTGAVYYSDRTTRRVRRVKNGILTTVAGDGSATTRPDGGQATATGFTLPQGLAFDTAGNLYIADAGADRVRKVTPAGIITTFATFDNPWALAFDASGNLLVARASCCVDRVDPTGKITRFAGNGSRGSTGDGGPAINATLTAPTGVAVDAAGNVYIADAQEQRIRKVTPAGIISTFAGDGTTPLGSGGLVVDRAGNLLIASQGRRQVLKATPAGTLSVLAGGGPSDQLGDGQLPTSATINWPNEMAFDAAGNLYIVDVESLRIRMIPGTPPSMQVAPSSLSFTGSSGGAPLAKAVTVTGSLAGLDFIVAVDTGGGGGWLTVDAAAASTPRVLSLIANPLNLAPGSYSANVTITPAAATPAKLTVGVTFVVGVAQPPKLASDLPNLSFTFPRGATASSASLKLSNTGGGTINFTASAATGADFLTISPPSGQLAPGSPVTISVTANPAGLAAGAYSGAVRIDAGAGGTLTIPVIVTVSSLTQALRLTQTGMSFTAVVQGGVVPSQTFGIVNVGSGVLNWTATTSTLAGGPNWLQIDTRSGASNAAAAAPQIAVSVNQAGLAAGNYYGLVRVNAPGAANTPQVVTVFLEVLPAGSDPGAMVQPQELVFNAIQGEPAPGAQTLLVYNIGATPKNLVTGREDDGFPVRIAPREATLDPAQPTRILLQPRARFLNTTSQFLNFQFSDGRVQSVRATVIVTPAAPASSTKPDDRAAGGCTPSRLVPALTSLGSSFAVSAGWPVALSVRVTDDCFNPQINGSVTVSFSNGDVPVTLAPLNDGTWQATWTSGRSTASGVTLRVDAVDSKQGLSGSREVDGTLRSDKDPPAFTQGSIGSAAFPVPYQPLAPGSFVSIFGARLADGFAAAQSLPLPPQLGNTQVIVAGELAPLHFVTEGQINFLVPYSVNTNTPQQVLIQRGLTYSQPVSVDLAAAQPGIFLSGGNAIVVGVRGDGSQFLVTPSAPAQADDVLVIYCAGLGPTDIPVVAGSQTPVDRLANTASPVTVTIGDQPAKVLFAGLTPGSSGLYQVNAVVPAGVSGAAVPIILTVAGQTSRAAPIAIR